MRKVPMLMLKNDYVPLPTRDELSRRSAAWRAQDQLRRSIEALEQFGDAVGVAARNLESAIVAFAEELKRTAQKRWMLTR